VTLAKETHQRKATPLYSIVCERRVRKDIFDAGVTLMKPGGGINQAVDAVGDAFEEERYLP
jgi:hypothetical protein